MNLGFEKEREGAPGKGGWTEKAGAGIVGRRIKMLNLCTMLYHGLVTVFSFQSAPYQVYLTSLRFYVFEKKICRYSIVNLSSYNEIFPTNYKFSCA